MNTYTMAQQASDEGFMSLMKEIGTLMFQFGLFAILAFFVFGAIISAPTWMRSITRSINDEIHKVRMDARTSGLNELSNLTELDYYNVVHAMKLDNIRTGQSNAELQPMIDKSRKLVSRPDFESEKLVTVDYAADAINYSRR